MDIQNIIYSFQWFFILYFLALQASYLFLNIASFFYIYRYVQESGFDVVDEEFSDFDPPVSVIAPAYNEESTIVASVRSLLQLHYSEYEVVVVNDGSSDGTLEVLKQEFSLGEFPEAYRATIETKKVRAIYHSPAFPKLRIIDKENGGKADALNAGINSSRYPLFCSIDADSILQPDSLKRAVAPFLEDEFMIASGGTVRIVNGCKVEEGVLKEVGLSSKLIVNIQIVEYLRAFLFGRMGWAPLNALLIISGAFGVFKKSAVLYAGGYKADSIGEDMELVVRLHRKFLLSRRPYRITFVPDPICWSEAPEDMKTLKNQRVRWQRGLSESLANNFSLFLNPKGGSVSWLAFPFFVFFEWLGPVIEMIGYIFITTGFFLDMISIQVFTVFFMFSVCFGLLVSVNALMLEEISFHIYQHPKHILKLLFCALIENFGYRQLNSYWRIKGLVLWALGKKGGWGSMKRKGSWTKV